MEKCEAISFGACKHSQVTIFDKLVPYKRSYKYLGIHLDSCFRLREHIDHVVKNLNKFCGLIYRVRHLYPTKCLLLFHDSLLSRSFAIVYFLMGQLQTNFKKLKAHQDELRRAILSERNMIH